MNLIENNPLDIEKIATLLKDKNDLFLVWPDARYPFDHRQWQDRFSQDRFNTGQGNLSFLIEENGKIIGHAALFPVERAKVYRLAFLYLDPDYRSQGLGTKMISLLEQYTVKNLNAQKLTLQVRDYNVRALKCYTKCGFKEYTRDDDLIKMEKYVGS